MRSLASRAPVADRLLGPALSVAVLLGAWAGTPVLLLAVLGCQGLAVASWHRALDVPGRAVGGVVAGAAAVAADGAAIAAGPDRPLAAVVAVLGLVVPAALVGQLVRRDGRAMLNPSLAATAALATVTTLSSAYLVAVEGRHGTAVVAAAAAGAGLTVTVLAWDQVLPGPRVLAVAAGPALAVPAGLLAGAVSGLGAGDGLVLAVCGAVSAAAGGLFAARTPVARPELAAAVPVLLAALPTFLLGRLLVG